MSEITPLELFSRELADDVDEAVQADGSEPYSETHFTGLILDRLADVNVFENPEQLTHGGEGRFGRTSYKITGYDFSDDDERLLLVTTVHTGIKPPRAVPKSDIESAFEKALRFYDASCKGLHTKMEPANTEATDLARRIHECNDRIKVLRVVVLSDGMLGARSREITDRYRGTTRIVVELYGIEQLHRMLGEGETRADIVIDVVQQLGAPIPCLKVGGTASDFETYLAAIPASLLANAYERFGTRLLELNVRAFLGVRGRKSVNAGLRRTLLQEPDHFLAYNNGIVATVDNIEVQTSDAVTWIVRLSGLQIVNGGQTTASIHRARRQDGADLSAISVPAKIIKVSGEKLDEMVGTISRSANSQNTVQPADFSANDPFHVAIEELANNTWLPGAAGRWFYERARGSYGAAEAKSGYSKVQQRKFRAETPKQRRFSKTDLAKVLNIWSGRPDHVSYGNQKNFQHFMQQLKQDHPDGFVPDTAWYKSLIAKLIVFRTVQAAVKTAKFPAYQANIAVYTTTLVAHRMGGVLAYDDIWSGQSVLPEFVSHVTDLARRVDEALRATADGRMPTEWAKRPDCWIAIKEVEIA